MTDRAHRIMTPEEYAAMPLIGWHRVCRDVDGAGNVGIQFGDQSMTDRNAAVERVKVAIMKAWDECGEVPFPIYEREAQQLAVAAVEAARTRGEQTISEKEG